MSSMLHFIDVWIQKKQQCMESFSKTGRVCVWTDYWLRYWWWCHPSSGPSSSSSCCWKQICHPETVIKLTPHSLSVPLIRARYSGYGPALGCGVSPHRAVYRLDRRLRARRNRAGEPKDLKTVLPPCGLNVDVWTSHYIFLLTFQKHH